MNTKLLLAASVAVVPATLMVANPFTPADTAPPFLDPSVVLSQRCSNPNLWETRQRIFKQIGQAYADTAIDAKAALTLPGDTVSAFSYDAGTQSAEAQSWFDTGLAHMANFNHADAVEAFRLAQSADPNCAMCYWGEGFALGGNINAPFNPDQGVLAAKAAAKAQSLVTREGKTKDLVAALIARNGVDETGAAIENPQAFADAMDAAAKTYPDDDFVLAVSAEANMNTQPWDYWEPGTNDPRGRTAATIARLETVLKRSPNYPPAIHLYIHITEASTDPFRAEAPADRLRDQSLKLGHLVHMPSHTYYRIGRWHKSLESNIDAVETDAAYIAKSGPENSYQYTYYPHNVHFAMTTAQVGGERDVAFDMANRLKAIFPPGTDRSMGWVEMIKVSPMFLSVQFDEADTILAMDAPSADQPFRMGIWHYARGEALARKGDYAAAAEEVAAIRARIDDPEVVRFWDEEFVPAPDVLRIAAGTVEARIMAGQGDMSGAIAKMEDVVEIQSGLPYTEPPFWYYPARQTLGAMLYADGQYDRAEWQFYQALVESPNNAWVLHGLAESYKAKGDRRAAKFTRGMFKDAWMGARGTAPDMKRL